ncbi:MAG: cell division protein SepF [Bacillota bacterium]|jgi:cell division inhibitor SepF|uniref:cell division protein SepF n=1 Tax=Bacillus sp. RO2 TaxID=2723913 RepID=UPI00145D1926|nr:cell division protein SepF [Bacillus sp. RO2]MEA3320026.1 cell division protein SepF [Bacillota bacterium]NMH72245.1 cell division protein SepF [Bacillus sp. RO2]
MTIKSKFKSFFALDDEEYEYKESEVYEEEEMVEEPRRTRSGTTQPASRQNVVSLQSVQKTSKVVLYEPRSYSEAQDVADHLKNRRAIIVNLQRIDIDQAKRIVDFLSGTVYAIGGDIQRIGQNIFLCTPDNVDVSGSISEIMQQEQEEYTDKRW